MRLGVIRAVVVHRPTDYQLLLMTHGTRGQAEFFLRSREQELAPVEREHERVQAAIASVLGVIPASWRRASVDRAELNRFLFEPADVVFAVGQDGLIANVAKYLDGQMVVGINPLPEKWDGVLVRHEPSGVREVMHAIESGRDVRVQERSMVEANMDDGQMLVALNEVFIGHRSHQSARYTIGVGEKKERQSSSGLICCTGTGATGWASSITRATRSSIDLPKPGDRAACYFVREAWVSKSTGGGVVSGRLEAGQKLSVISEMNQGGVIFGDGIEDDHLEFSWGRTARVGVSERRLRLVE